jgi:cold shock CspA family protein
MSLLSGVSPPDLDVHPSLFDRGLGHGTLGEGQQADFEVTQGPEGLQVSALA